MGQSGSPDRSRGLDIAAIVSSIILGLITLWIAFVSLGWRMEHDLPIVLYFGWLIDHLGFVPYRDFFDPNPPGTYLLAIVMGRLAGYWNDFGLRCFDLACLFAITALTYGWMRRIGWRQALLGPVLFAFIYLSTGPTNSLEREYCLILPVTAALFIIFGMPAGADLVKGLAAGLLFGLGFTIKPHIVLLMPWIMLFHGLDLRARNGDPAWFARRNVLPMVMWIIGAAIAPLMALYYVWTIGALPSFWDMATHYWGLYGQQISSDKPLSAFDRFAHLATKTITRNLMNSWMPVAILGLLSSLMFGVLEVRQRRLVLMLAGLAIISIFYVTLAGKFFDYHWLIASFFLCQIIALNLTRLKNVPQRSLRMLPVGALLFSLFFLTDPLLLITTGFKHFKPHPPNESGRVDAIANYLKANLRPGDKVQPLDWTDGATQAMLMTQAPIASRFNGDYMFCHNVSNPYIQSLRREFTETMERVKPRYVIYVDTNRPWGLDCDTNTTGLIPHFVDRYSVALKGDRFELFKRRDNNSTASPANSQ